MNNRKRNIRSRKPKRVILIAFEGINKTEKKYLKSFESRDSDYKILIVPGNETDPVNLVKKTIDKIKTEALNLNEDDKAYCVFDADMNPNKNAQIGEARKLAERHKIEIIVSSPCVEIWFLLHYEYTTRTMTSDEVIKRLKKHYPQYEKNADIYKEINDQTHEAIKRAHKLRKYHLANGEKIQTVEANPYTEIPKILENLLNNVNGV